MKLISFYFFLSSIQLFSQSFLNIHFSDGSYKYSAIGSLQKITINESTGQFNFYISNDTIVSENIADIKKFSIDPLPLGEPLPVELSSFNASLSGSNVELRWRTESEVNNFGFEVQRTFSLIAPEWKKVGFVEGSSNSNSPRDYLFTDNLSKQSIYYYRLKQIDNDGRYEYSSVVSIEFVTPNHYSLNQNYPNPFNPATNISYNLPVDGFVTIKIFDIMGSEVSTLINENQKAGSHIIKFDGSEYASGFYICRMTSINFTHSIKMLLLK